MSILVIDNSVDNRYQLRSVLDQAGYGDVLTLRSSGEMLEYFSNPQRMIPKIDLVILNIDQESIDFCRDIKDDKRLCHTPILAVSEDKSIDQMKLAFAIGVSDYISKPFSDEELLARVRVQLRIKYERDLLRYRELSLVEMAHQLEEANYILQRSSSVDGLTGIINRCFFDELYKKEFKRASRERLPMSLILIDIDHFKEYNDTYGHQAGDECLKKVAKAMQQCLRRPADILARYGGEEFTVSLPNTSLDGAAKVAECMRGAVEQLDIVHETSKVSKCVTVSAGYTTFLPGHDLTAENVISCADEALYRAKHEGRNRINGYKQEGVPFSTTDVNPAPDSLEDIRKKISTLEESLHNLTGDSEYVPKPKTFSRNLSKQNGKVDPLDKQLYDAVDFIEGMVPVNSYNEGMHDGVAIPLETDELATEWNMFFKSSRSLVAVLDEDRKCIQINPSLCTYLDVEEQALIGELFDQFIHPDERQQFVDKLSPVEGESIAAWLETRLNTDDDIWIFWEAVQEGSRARMLLTGTDITENKGIHDLLEQRTRALEQMIELK